MYMYMHHTCILHTYIYTKHTPGSKFKAIVEVHTHTHTQHIYIVLCIILHVHVHTSGGVQSSNSSTLSSLRHLTCYLEECVLKLCIIHTRGLKPTFLSISRACSRLKLLAKYKITHKKLKWHIL